MGFPTTNGSRNETECSFFSLQEIVNEATGWRTVRGQCGDENGMLTTFGHVLEYVEASTKTVEPPAGGDEPSSRESSDALVQCFDARSRGQNKRRRERR